MALNIKKSRFDDFLTFLVLEPRISSFYYTNFKQIKKNQGSSLENIIYGKEVINFPLMKSTKAWM